MANNTKGAMIGFLMKDSTAFLEKCIKRLYKEQTAGEQTVNQTVTQNNRGFNPADANKLSRLAKKLNDNPSWHLDERDFNDASERMQKYSKQLARYLTDEEVV